jgi:hypothetical protein
LNKKFSVAKGRPKKPDFQKKITSEIESLRSHTKRMYDVRMFVCVSGWMLEKKEENWPKSPFYSDDSWQDYVMSWHIFLLLFCCCLVNYIFCVNLMILGVLWFSLGWVCLSLLQFVCRCVCVCDFFSILVNVRMCHLLNSGIKFLYSVYRFEKEEWDDKDERKKYKFADNNFMKQRKVFNEIFERPWLLRIKFSI